MARATQEGRVNCVMYYKIDQKSSWHQGRPVVVIRRGSPKQTKESARRYVIYCVTLCSCGPYVSIVWGSAICFYYGALGQMFLLVGCGRGTRPYVSIMWR